MDSTNTDLASLLEVKSCTKCGEVKSLTDYYAHKPSSDGRQSWCKQCHCGLSRQMYIANPQRKQATNAAWDKANREKRAAISRAWRANNPEAAAATTRAYEAANPEKGYARCGTRRATKRNATPVWANRFFIQEAYHLAKMRTKHTGFVWHVDHAIPLKSKMVCGLHCEANLSVIPGWLNMSKGNRF